MDNASDVVASNGILDKFTEIVSKVGTHADLIVESLLVFTGGIISIYLIHKAAEIFLFPHVGKGRVMRVIGLIVYSSILLATALLVLDGLGVHVASVGRIGLVTIFVLAVVVFLVWPFLPKLPFGVGDSIEIGGEMGTVTEMSPLFTKLQKYDGTLAFVPNMLTMSLTVRNYSRIARRRIEFNLLVQSDVDLPRTKELLVQLMARDERVLDVPSDPSIFVVKADADSIDLSAVCWVKNEDWFDARSDLWEEIIRLSKGEMRLASSLPSGYQVERDK